MLSYRQSVTDAEYIFYESKSDLAFVVLSISWDLRASVTFWVQAHVPGCTSAYALFLMCVLFSSRKTLKHMVWKGVTAYSLLLATETQMCLTQPSDFGSIS